MKPKRSAKLPLAEFLEAAPLVTLGDLPPEATFATVHYCIESDDMPTNAESVSVFRNVPARLAEVPVAAIAKAMMNFTEIAQAFRSFDAYHQWYIGYNDTPSHGAENRWPCIASHMEDEVIQDGSHRMHSYIRDRHETIPVMEYDARAWWKAHANWKMQQINADDAPMTAPPKRGVRP